MSTQVTEKPLATRLLRVIKMNLSNPWPTLITPWLILAVLLTTAFFFELWLTSIGATGVFFEPEQFLIIYLLVIANQVFLNQFPLALSYGVTRRDFYLGTVLSLTFVAFASTVGITLVSILRGANDLTDLLNAAGANFSALLASELLAVTLTALYFRFRNIGMVTFFVTTGTLMAGSPFVVTYLDLWDELERFAFSSSWEFARTVIGWSVIALMLLIGYGLIRRANPQLR
ncbi:MAG: hypothetical protein K9G13_02845 [Aquiluna sp.]|nr:hypothetical protein [Aquiluna sp.]MCF8545460.1 hypothetical protein [Aquiluna sp.]